MMQDAVIIINIMWVVWSLLNWTNIFLRECVCFSSSRFPVLPFVNYSIIHSSQPASGPTTRSSQLEWCLGGTTVVGDFAWWSSSSPGLCSSSAETVWFALFWFCSVPRWGLDSHKMIVILCTLAVLFGGRGGLVTSAEW